MAEHTHGVPVAGGQPRDGDLFDKPKFENAKITKMADVIESFYKLDLSKEIDLPQLVIVGDQSAGKSSLLENLTELPFPIGPDLCTRFATKVTIRRGDRNVVRAELSDKSLHFRRDYEKGVNDFDSAAFKKLIEDASKALKVPSLDKPTNEHDFSKTMLEIEVTNQNQSMLAFVDTPGIYVSETNDQSLAGIDIVNGLIGDLVSQKRTIVVAVMDAQKLGSSQTVFNETKKFDKDGSRTIGVLTKVDRVQEGDEKPVLTLAKNETISLARNCWFMVKNKTTFQHNEKIPLVQAREDEKALFAKSPWKSLNPARLGIDNLREFLCDEYARHVQKEFPALQKEMVKMLEEAQEQLGKLGRARQTTEEQRRYLTDVVDAYLKVVEDCRTDRIIRSETSTDQKLEAVPFKLKCLNNDYEMIMKREGTQRDFALVGRAADPNFDRLASRTFDEFQQTNRDEVESNIYSWINRELHETSGHSFIGTIPSQLLRKLFREQTRSWKEVSSNHIDHVGTYLKQHMSQLLEHVCGSNKPLSDTLLALLESRTDKEITAAHKEIQVLYQDIHDALSTRNSQFDRNLINVRARRFLASVDRASINFKAARTESHPKSLFDNVEIAQWVIEQTSNSLRYTVFEIHDILQAYYDVVFSNFMDNVVRIGDRLVYGENSPLLRISRDWVDTLSRDELQAIAGESKDMACERKRLTRLIKKFREALELSKQIRPLEILPPPPNAQLCGSTDIFHGIVGSGPLIVLQGQTNDLQDKSTHNPVAVEENGVLTPSSTPNHKANPVRDTRSRSVSPSPRPSSPGGAFNFVPGPQPIPWPKQSDAMSVPSLAA